MQISRTQKQPKYKQAAHYIEKLIAKGSLNAGDQIPSLRELAGVLGMGVNTVRDAYWDLERRGIIASIPQSGHYVRSRGPVLSPVTPRSLDPKQISLCRIYDQHVRMGKSGTAAALSVVQLDPDLWPTWKAMAGAAGKLSGMSDKRLLDYSMSPGLPALQRAIARQLSSWGLGVSPDSILITSGCTEAISLTLGELCEPGDVVAVESPLYFTFLNLLKYLEVQIIEIPNHPTTGLNLDILEFVLQRNSVRAVLCSPNFSNPLGCLMPEENKRRLVELARAYDTFIIEDDVYGDLAYLSPRPKPVKVYDTDDRVAYCSSYSKTISPGLRIGWLVNDTLFDSLAERKTLLNLAASTPGQAMLAGFLESRSYDRHVRKVQSIVKNNCLEITARILAGFPEGTAVGRPQGGLALWVQFPEWVDSEKLYDKALREDILLVPGILFTIGSGFRSCMRFNVGIWNDRVAQVVDRVGRLVRDMEEPTDLPFSS